jgi:hypothetical protein
MRPNKRRRLYVRGERAPVPQRAASRYVCVRTQDCKRRRGTARAPPFLLHDVKQPATQPPTAQHISFPRRISASGFVFPFRTRPDEGRAERRQAHGCSGTRSGLPSARPRASCDTRVRGGRPGACEAPWRPSREGRAPLGAPPWRFSAGGRASISGIASGSVQRAPRSQVVMPGGRCPGPPEPAVTSRSRGTPLPALPSGSSPETPLHERGCESYTTNSLRSQAISTNRSRWKSSYRFDHTASS